MIIDKIKITTSLDNNMDLTTILSIKFDLVKHKLIKLFLSSGRDQTLLNSRKYDNGFHNDIYFSFLWKNFSIKRFDLIIICVAIFQ